MRELELRILYIVRYHNKCLRGVYGDRGFTLCVEVEAGARFLWFGKHSRCRHL